MVEFIEAKKEEVEEEVEDILIVALDATNNRRRSPLLRNCT